MWNSFLIDGVINHVLSVYLSILSRERERERERERLDSVCVCVCVCVCSIFITTDVCMGWSYEWLWRFWRLCVAFLQFEEPEASRMINISGIQSSQLPPARQWLHAFIDLQRSVQGIKTFAAWMWINATEDYTLIALYSSYSCDLLLWVS